MVLPVHGVKLLALNHYFLFESMDHACSDDIVKVSHLANLKTSDFD